MSSTPLDPSQAAKVVALTDVASDYADDMPEIGEGEKLRRLLTAKRYDQKELADAIGITKAAVGLWMKRPKFTPKVWERVRQGLVTLGLDPDEIRPASGEPRPPVEDLTRLVENWPRVQLLVLKRVLESDDTSREILLAYINGSLRQIP